MQVGETNLSFFKGGLGNSKAKGLEEIRTEEIRTEVGYGYNRFPIGNFTLTA